MKRVLITGGAGFIGTHLACLLHGTGEVRVTVLDNLSPQVHGEGAEFSPELKAAARCVRGDVTRAEDCRAALDGQDGVVHLAAETGTGQSMYEIDRYCAVNVMGTATLLEACKERRGTLRKVVLASSRAVYGEGKYSCASCGMFHPEPREGSRMERGDFEVHCPNCDRPAAAVPTDEDSPARPLSVYGATKLMQEHLVRVFGAAFGVPCVALRFQNVFGPGQSLKNPYTGILSIFSTRIMNGNPIEIYEDGKESRDFVHVADVVRAVALALHRETSPWACYNVGTGAGTSVDEVVESLMGAYGLRVPVARQGKFRLGDIRHNLADTSKIRSDLGFLAGRTFREGVAEFAEWVRSYGAVEDLYEKSRGEIEGQALLKTSRKQDGADLEGEVPKGSGFRADP